MTCDHCEDSITAHPFRVGGMTFCGSRCSIARMGQIVQDQRTIAAQDFDAFHLAVQGYLARHV